MTEQRSTLLGRIVGGIVIFALISLLVFAYFDDATAKPVRPNGDMLGSESAESFTDYQARAEASLAAADEPAYSLVTFEQPLSPTDAASVLEPVDRVNAMIVAFAAPFSLPEPIDGETRKDVFTRELDRIADSLSGIGDVPTPSRFDAAVIHDDGDTLREVASTPGVATVEVLPFDSAWGSFGVRPVEVPSRS